MSNDEHPTPVLSVRDPNRDQMAIWDHWNEFARTFSGAPDGALGLVGIDRSYSPRHPVNRNPAVGWRMRFDCVATGPNVRSLSHVDRAPLAQPGQFRTVPNVAARVAQAVPAIRKALVESLAGATADVDGTVRSCIGDSDIAVESGTERWEVVAGDGCRRSGRNLRGLAAAIGAVPDGVLAGHIINGIFCGGLSPEAMRRIAEAVSPSAAFANTMKKVKCRRAPAKKEVA